MSCCSRSREIVMTGAKCCIDSSYNDADDDEHHCNYMMMRDKSNA